MIYSRSDLLCPPIGRFVSGRARKSFSRGPKTRTNHASKGRGGQVRPLRVSQRLIARPFVPHSITTDCRFPGGRVFDGDAKTERYPFSRHRIRYILVRARHSTRFIIIFLFFFLRLFFARTRLRAAAPSVGTAAKTSETVTTLAGLRDKRARASAISRTHARMIDRIGGEALL